MTEGETIPSEEIREEINQMLASAERILRGTYATKEFDPNSFDPGEVFTGPVLDLNDDSLTPSEIDLLTSWIENKLGNKIDTAPIKSTYLSPDGETTVKIFDIVLGQEGDPYLFSQWQNEGEKPTYLMWQVEMYDEQLELGFEEVQE